MRDKIFISSPWVSQEKEQRRALGRITDTVTDKHNNQMQEINLIPSRMKIKEIRNRLHHNQKLSNNNIKRNKKVVWWIKEGKKNNPALGNLTDSKVNPAVYKNNYVLWPHEIYFSYLIMIWHLKIYVICPTIC